MRRASGGAAAAAARGHERGELAAGAGRVAAARAAAARRRHVRAHAIQAGAQYVSDAILLFYFHTPTAFWLELVLNN